MLAIIPARGGSKGLPRKNILKLSGKPLIAYTIEAALSSERVSKVFVSTDSEEIAEIARMYGAWVPELRPSELATDTTKSIDVFLYTINYIRENYNLTVDEFIVLQPTSPLRKSYHIDAAIEKFNMEKADSVISFTECDHPLEWCKRIDNYGRFIDIFHQTVSSNRQEVTKTYYPNGAIYVFSTDFILKTNTYYGKNSFAFIMSREDSLDIDSKLDFEIADFLVTKGVLNV